MFRLIDISRTIDKYIHNEVLRLKKRDHSACHLLGHQFPEQNLFGCKIIGCRTSRCNTIPKRRTGQHFLRDGMEWTSRDRQDHHAL